MFIWTGIPYGKVGRIAMIYLDTHAVIWLHASRESSFPRRARALLESEELLISPAVYLEMEYLFEAEKIRPHAEEIFNYLEKQISLRFSDIPFSQVVRKAAIMSWTRDPFDRLIVAEAFTADAYLLSKDREILPHYPKALWK